MGVDFVRVDFVHMKKSDDKLGCYHLKKSVKWCEFPRILQ